MSLEQKLTEEQRQRILNTVERERRKLLVVSAYEKLEVAPHNLESLSALASADQPFFLQLVEGWFHSQHISREALVTLAYLNLDKYLEYCNLAMYDIWQGNKAAVVSSAAEVIDLAPDNFIRLYDWAIDYWDVGPGLPRKVVPYLGALAHVNKDKFIELYHKGISVRDSDLTLETAKTLQALAAVDKNLFVELYQRGIKRRDFTERSSSLIQGTILSLPALATVDPDRFMQLFEELASELEPAFREPLTSEEEESDVDKVVASYSNTIRPLIPHLLTALAHVTPELYLHFFNVYTRRPVVPEFELESSMKEVGKSVAGLAHSRPDLLLELCRKATLPTSELRIEVGGKVTYFPSLRMRKYAALAEGVAEILGEVASINLDAYLEIYNQLLQWRIDSIATKAVASLRTVAPISQNAFIHALTEAIDSSDPGQRSGVQEIIDEAASIDPNLYLQLSRQYYREDIDIFPHAYKHVRGLVRTIQQDPLIPIRDEEYDFLIAFLDSKYVREFGGSRIIQEEVVISYDHDELKDEERITAELRGLVHKTPSLDIKRLHAVLQAGEVQDLEEMAECASVDSTYLAVRKLGAGKGGRTYKVYSSELKQYRALKVIDMERVNPREAELMARLRGQELENIVQVYEAGPHLVRVNGEEKYAIVMEYVPGHTLDGTGFHLLSYDGRPWGAILKYSAKIFLGIMALRRHGLFHRDLRPENIIINTDDDVIKIIDFGLCTDEGEAKPVDNRRYGGPTDLFSLGLITYRMGTGENLFAAHDQELETSSYADLVAGLKESMFEGGKLREEYTLKIQQNLPPEMREVVTGCLESDDPRRVAHSYVRANPELGYYFMTRDQLIGRIKELEQNVPQK